MELDSFLSVDNTLIDVAAANKTKLLDDLCSRAAKATGLDARAVSDAIQKREDLGSTGMGGGVAIPHARIPELKRTFGVLARLQRPIDFDAIDRRPVDVVFLLLLPTAASGEHLNVLAAVSRKLREPATLRILRDARDRATLYSVMVSPALSLKS